MVQALPDDIYAVVVPDSVQQCRDVLSGSQNLVNSTTCPFGLSIHAWEADQPSQKSLQKLIFVSEQAARDRAPDKHVVNGMGVKPGWYLIAQPRRFEVRASMVNLNYCLLPWENALVISLEVDGQNTNDRRILVQNQVGWPDSSSGPFVFTGYVEECSPFPGSGNKRLDKIRPFAFETVSNALETKKDDSNQIGTIKLKVYAGVARPAAPWKKRSYIYSDAQVSAKSIAREGRSIQVSRKQSPATQIRELSRYIESNPRNLAEAEITVYVRERSWLLSRRLIDDNDKPIPYGEFRRLLQELQSSVCLTQVFHGYVNVDEGPAKKKPKIKKEMVVNCDMDPAEPGEVIDLT